MGGSYISNAICSQTSSTSSSTSRFKKQYRYRTTARSSQVDENLFGTPNKLQLITEGTDRERTRERKVRGRYFGTSDKVQLRDGGVPADADIRKQARERKAKRQRELSCDRNLKESIQLVTKDLIRNLLVPEKNRSSKPILVTCGDYMRLKDSARVLTEQERLMQMERARADKEEDMADAEGRKDALIQADRHRLKNEKLSEIEREKQEKREHLKERALRQKYEQEDEIKHFDEVILTAKCQEIRKNQIAERIKLQEEVKQEERRLDSMMEEDRQRALQVEFEAAENRRNERCLGSMKIMEQITQKEEEKLLDLDRKDQESKVHKKYMDKLCEEEEERLNMEREESQRFREELNKCTTAIMHRKQLTENEEKLLEEKVMQYQQEKAARERAYEEEQERVRIAKEMEVARLRAQQERARDQQAERDALRAKRALERDEREWRRKEVEEKRKNAEKEDQLKKDRAQQADLKDYFQAVQAQRDRSDYERVLKAQLELVEKSKWADAEKFKKRDVYADEVRAQMKEKEQRGVSDYRALVEEGVKLQEEAQIRRIRLDDIKAKKLDELRSMGVDDKYVTKVSHQT